MFEYQRLAVM